MEVKEPNKTQNEIQKANEETDDEEEVKESFNLIEKGANKILSKVEAKYAPKLRKELNFLKSVIISKEIFRIALIGRKGSGKASLINALIDNNVRKENSFEKDEMMWEAVTGTKWEVINVSCYEQGEKENEQKNNADEVLSSFKDAIHASEKWPDVVFFLLKATEVESDIKPDILFLEQISKFLNHTRPKDKTSKVPVFVILTHIDMLPPISVIPREKYYKNKEIAQKRRNMTKAVSQFQNTLQSIMKSDFKVNGVFPVCCYVNWEEYNKDPGKGFEEKTDLRYGLEEFAKNVFESLRNQVKFNFTNSLYFSTTKKKMARVIIASFSTITSIIAASPIPLSDFPIVTSIRALMLYIIKQLSPPKQKTLTWGGFFLFCGMSIGVSYAVRATVRQIIKFVPVLGSTVSVGMAFSSTWMLGELGVLYFIRGVSHFDRRAKRKEKKRMKKAMAEKGLEI